MNSKGFDRGFTRTDLSATLGAVALLGILFLTTAGDTGARSHAAGCLANMRRLSQAWQLYAADNRDFFPGNVDDGGMQNWVFGNAWAGNGDPPNGELMLDGRYSSLGPYSRDPAIYRCPAYPATVQSGTSSGRIVRTAAANQAVGTQHDGYSPVHGPWLDGSHSHLANRTWYTYGKTSDIVHPAPPQLWLLIDEDEFSINDGGFALSMRQPGEWIDWPGTRHDVGAGISFADGSAEIHRWKDSRTPVRNGNVSRRSVPGGEDLLWLQNHTTERVAGN